MPRQRLRFGARPLAAGGSFKSAIERLADADAFRSLGLDRRDALWAAKGLGAGSLKERLPLFDTPAYRQAREPDVHLPPMPLGEHVVNDYRYLSLSLKAHPVSFIRQPLTREGILACRDLEAIKSGRRVNIAGLVLVRQRPGSASGVIFMTLEDETGIGNVIVWPKMFERFRPVVLGSRLVSVRGLVQNESGVIHVVAEEMVDRTPMLSCLSEANGDVQSFARADEVKRPSVDMREKVARAAGMMRHPRDWSIGLFGKADEAERAAAEADSVMPKGRNFH